MKIFSFLLSLLLLLLCHYIIFIDDVCTYKQRYYTQRLFMRSLLLLELIWSLKFGGGYVQARYFRVRYYLFYLKVFNLYYIMTTIMVDLLVLL